MPSHQRRMRDLAANAPAIGLNRVLGLGAVEDLDKALSI